jgi:hypothetical protein
MDEAIAKGLSDLGSGVAAYGESIAAAMTDVATTRCDCKQTMQGNEIDWRNDTLYNGYPRQVIIGYDDAGNPIYDTYGPVADYNAYVHKIEDNRRAIAEREQARKDDAFDIGKILAALVLGTATVKYAQLWGDMEAAIEDVSKMVDNARAQGQKLIDKMGAQLDALGDDVAASRAANDALRARADERSVATWDLWFGSWKPQSEIIAGLVGAIAQDARASIKEADTFMALLADEAKAHFDAAYKAGDAAFSTTALEAAECLVGKVCAIRDWLDDNAKKIEAFWDTAYQAHHSTLNAVTTPGGVDGVADTKRSVDTLNGYSIARNGYYDGNYAGGEGGLAGQVLADGTTQSGNSVTDHDTMVTDADTRKAHYAGTYKPGEDTLAVTTLAEADTLVAMLSDIFDWLSEQGDELQQFWQDVYKAAEANTAPTVINRGQALSDFSEELIRAIKAFADDMMAYWDEVYRAAEAYTAPIIIRNGADGSDQVETTYDFFEDRYEDFWNRWDQHWYPCDTKDLKFHCDMWDKHDMLEDIKSNSDLARDQADINWDAHSEHGLPCETKRLDEICAMPVYQPQYCEVEGKAILHVRQQTDRAKEEAIRCTNRYCAGAAEYQVEQLNIRGAMLETAALQAAHRYEKWWYVMEENRRHKYHQDIFTVSEKWPDNVLNSLKRSSDDNDRIIEDIHKRIVRGYTYLENMQNAGRSTLQGAADAVRFAIEQIRTGHFFPQINLDALRAADSGSRDNVQMALRAIEIGHFHPKTAQAAKQLAGAVAEAAGRLGNQMIELGHFHPRLAAQLMEQSSTNASRHVGHGIDMARVGHDHFQQAGTDSLRSGQLADSAVGRAIAALQAGPQYAQLAADKAKSAADISLRGWQNGNYTVQNGQNWMKFSAGNNTDRRKLSGAEFDSMGRLSQSAAAYNDMARQWDNLNANIVQSTLKSAIDALIRGVDVAYTGASNTANATFRGSEIGLQQAAGVINGALSFYGYNSAPTGTYGGSVMPPPPAVGQSAYQATSPAASAASYGGNGGNGGFGVSDVFAFF